MPRLWQVHFLLIMALLRPGSAICAEPDTPLLTECRQLLSDVVVKPYGWALPDSTPSQTPLPRGARVAAFDPMTTPAAGWIISRAARLSGSAELAEAARKLARGVVAAQQPSGHIPARAVFASNVIVRETGAALRDRTATTACLGFLLAYLQDNPDDELVRRGAMRAAQWLLREQTPTGAWGTDLPGPGDRTLRLMRLDTPDVRDCIFSLALAARTFKQVGLGHGARRSIDLLLHLRIPAPSRTAEGLWRGLYFLSGVPCEQFQDRGGVDVLATRYAMQAMLGQALLADDADADAAFGRAAASLQRIKFTDDRWCRVYLLSGAEIADVPSGPAPSDERVFANQVVDAQPIYRQTGAFGLTRLLPLVDPRNRPPASLAWEDVTLALVGLTDRPFTFPRPTDAAGARAALVHGVPLWKVLDGPVPDNLPDRLSRLTVRIYREELARVLAP